MNVRRIKIIVSYVLVVIMLIGQIEFMVPAKASTDEPEALWITVTPNVATIQRGTALQFMAEVHGINSPSQYVNWSVENTENQFTKFNSPGELTVDSRETERTLVVRATCVDNPEISTTATVTVVDPSPEQMEIQLGTQGIAKDDIVYLGQYDSNGKSYSIPWYTLDDGLMFSKYTIGNSKFRESKDTGLYNYQVANQTENVSVLKTLIDGLYNGQDSIFTSLEQKVVKETVLSGKSMALNETVPDTMSYLFPLSVQEIQERNLNSDMLKTTSVNDQEGDNVSWWTRSCSNSPICANKEGTGLETKTADTECGVRPAFVLDASSVFLIFLSRNSKMRVGGCLEAKDKEANQWKLTLKDEADQSFAATIPDKIDVGASETIEVTKAGQGSVEYNQTSAMLIDSNNCVVGYSRLGDVSVGEKRLSLPYVSDGTYTLKVFQEQVNDGYATDYVGQVITKKVKVTNSQLFTVGEYHEWMQDFDISDLSTVKFVDNNYNCIDMAANGISLVSTGVENCYHLQGTLIGNIYDLITMCYIDINGNPQESRIYSLRGCPTITGVPTQKKISPLEKSFQLTPTLRNGDGDSIDLSKLWDYDEIDSYITYSSSNENVATVSSSGIVSVLGEGTTTLTVNSVSCNAYKPASPVKCVLTVEKTTPAVVKTNINKAKVKKLSAYTYSGKKINPSPKLTYQSKTLKKGIDYTLTYSKNKNAGKATITIKGKGNFTGTTKKTFKIKKASIKKVKVKGQMKLTYKGLKLKKGKAFSIIYKKNATAKKIKVKIKGKGNFTGKRIIYYKRKRKATSAK